MAEKKTAFINTKVEAIRRFFSDSKAKNHPIKEHPISQADEYVRDLYFDMLCVVAQYECSDTENGFTLIRRIMAACESTQLLEEYIKHSMEITPDRTAEFVKQCKDNKLCEIFMIDAMLLSCANGTPNAKQVGFIAQFGDMLGFESRKMEEMSKFAFAILEQDSDGYQALLKDENATVQESLLGYAKEFVTGVIMNTSKKQHYYASKVKSFQLEYYVFEWKNLNELVFENYIIDLFPLSFFAVYNVIFRNCRFENWSIREHNIYDCRGYITIEQYNKFVLDSCRFSNLHDAPSRTSIIYSKVQESEHSVEIMNCEFTNCVTYWDSEGVILLSYNNNYAKRVTLKVYDSQFNSCMEKNKVGQLFRGCYPVEQKNNTFVNCCDFDY